MKKAVVNTTISSQFFFKLLISAIRYPNAMKAPGANTNTNIPYSSGRMAKSNTLPVPKNSRTAPSNVKAMVKPSPIPIPSNIEATALFLAAKSSARPTPIQYTTNNELKNPIVANNHVT